MGVNDQRYTPAALQREAMPIVQKVPGPVWYGAVNLAPTEIRFPDRSTATSRYTDYAKKK